MKLFVLDEREIWHRPLIEAAQARGYQAKRIRRGEEASGPGWGFIRCHADPDILPLNLKDDRIMRSRLSMVQDRAQVEVYERKSEQYRRWGQFMPMSWLFRSETEAQEFVARWGGPLVSKAEVGASSANVRILKTQREQSDHLRQIFGGGILCDHGSGGRGGRQCRSLQKDYAFLQAWIPHEVTWRVNIVGSAWAIFCRFNYPDRPVAQTGNVEPLMKLDTQAESLLAFAAEVREAIGSRWCALDILKDGSRWRLIETSLAWPWPSPGACMSAPFFGKTERKWKEMWELLLDEIEAGAWALSS